MYEKTGLFKTCLKIAGRKPPALVDPSHKVRQGGKGSVWDGTVITLGSKATNSPPQERGVQGGGATLKGHRATDTRWTDTGQTPDGHRTDTERTPDGHRTDTVWVWGCVWTDTGQTPDGQ